MTYEYHCLYERKESGTGQERERREIRWRQDGTQNTEQAREGRKRRETTEGETVPGSVTIILVSRDSKEYLVFTLRGL